MSQLQVTVMFSGCYFLVGFVIVFIAMEHNASAKRTFQQLIELSRVAWLAGAVVAAILWPIILWDEARRVIRRWKNPALKWKPGTPEFDAAIGAAVRKKLLSIKDIPLCGACRTPVMDWEEQKVKWNSRAAGKFFLVSMDPASIRCKACRGTI